MQHPITDKPVLVTGATGFIATYTVKQLLEHGYKVRGTVRSLKKKESYQYLLDFPNAETNLEDL
jgi:dihydroflavonol-4-reductase